MKIYLIVITDFICWVPFIIVCFLHYGELIDFSKWYPHLSVIVLPLNSVINPMLYSTMLFDSVSALFSTVWKVSGRTYRTTLSKFRQATISGNIDCDPTEAADHANPPVEPPSELVTNL